MTEHLVSGRAGWRTPHPLGLPQRSEPAVRPPADPVEPPLAWTRSVRGWSPTSWRQDVR